MANMNRTLTTTVKFGMDESSKKKTYSAIAAIKKRLEDAVKDIEQKLKDSHKKYTNNAEKRIEVDEKAARARVKAEAKAISDIEALERKRERSHRARLVRLGRAEQAARAPFKASYAQGRAEELLKGQRVTGSIPEGLKGLFPFLRGAPIMGGTGVPNFAKSLKSQMEQRFAKEAEAAKQQAQVVKDNLKQEKERNQTLKDIVKLENKLKRERDREAKESERAADIARRERQRSRSAAMGRLRGYIPGGGGVSNIGIGGITVGGVASNFITRGIDRVMEFGANALGGIVKAGAGLEAAQVATGVLLNNETKGKALLRTLQRLGAETPLRFRDLQKQATVLLQYQVPEAQLVGALKNIGDVTGGNQERFASMAYAYAQVMSATKLRGTELRQMTEAGFNPLSEMVRVAQAKGQTGVTISSLTEQMSRGEISAEAVAEAFRTATSAGGPFNNFMVKMATTLQGLWSTLNDELEITGQTIGSKLIPVLKQLVSGGILFARGDLSKIGTNIAENLVPVVYKAAAAVGVFMEKVFGLSNILETLKDKNKAAAFFKSISDWIMEALPGFIKFGLELKSIIGLLLDVMMPVIKFMATHLDLVFKAGIGLVVGKLATDIGKIADSLAIISGLGSPSSWILKLLGIGAAGAGVGAAATAGASGGILASAKGALAGLGSRLLAGAPAFALMGMLGSRNAYTPVEAYKAGLLPSEDLKSYYEQGTITKEEYDNAIKQGVDKTALRSVLDFFGITKSKPGSTSEQVQSSEQDQGKGFLDVLKETAAKASDGISNLTSSSDQKSKASSDELVKSVASMEKLIRSWSIKYDTNEDAKKQKAAMATPDFSLSAEMEAMVRKALAGGPGIVATVGI